MSAKINKMKWCLKKNLFPAGIIILFFMVSGVLPQCIDCEKEKSAKNTIMPGDKAKAERICDRYNKLLIEKKYDYSKGEAINKINFLKGMFEVREPNIAIRECKTKLMVYLLKNDPNAYIRYYAVSRLDGSAEYEVCKEALNDPSINVRIEAAGKVLFGDNLKKKPDPKALQILKDAAIGIGRADWDVRDFIEEGGIKMDPDEVNKKRDAQQLKAFDILGRFYELHSIPAGDVGFIDSVMKNTKSEEIRKNSKHVLELKKKGIAPDVERKWPSENKSSK
jgi:hypothetical protein